jgi:hypothetical protein
VVAVRRGGVDVDELRSIQPGSKFTKEAWVTLNRVLQRQLHTPKTLARTTEQEGSYRQSIVSKVMTTLDILHASDTSEGFLSYHVTAIANYSK